jgi:hypothetical protein
MDGLLIMVSESTAEAKAGARNDGKTEGRMIDASNFYAGEVIDVKGLMEYSNIKSLQVSRAQGQIHNTCSMS